MEQPKPGTSKLLTVQQVSAGGVAFRLGAATAEIAIVSVGIKLRWQLYPSIGGANFDGYAVLCPSDDSLRIVD